jgi:plastocyanin
VLGASIGLASLLGVAIAPAYAEEPHREIAVHDACDSKTFNAEVGPGTCVRGPGLPIDKFFHDVEVNHQVRAWSINPGTVSTNSVDPIYVRNTGGEVHTFTEVARFGGGLVPLLNDLGGFGPTVPECATLNEQTHILNPGESTIFTVSAAGTHLYQCCVHPWMHATLTIKQVGIGLVGPR